MGGQLWRQLSSGPWVWNTPAGLSHSDSQMHASHPSSWRLWPLSISICHLRVTSPAVKSASSGTLQLLDSSLGCSAYSTTNKERLDSKPKATWLEGDKLKIWISPLCPIVSSAPTSTLSFSRLIKSKVRLSVHWIWVKPRQLFMVTGWQLGP